MSEFMIYYILFVFGWFIIGITFSYIIWLIEKWYVSKYNQQFVWFRTEWLMVEDGTTNEIINDYTFFNKVIGAFFGAFCIIALFGTLLVLLYDQILRKCLK